MGRSKKRSRASSSRLNPLRKAESNGNGKDANVVNKKLQPLLQNLSSVVPNDRSIALSSISVLCEDAHMRQLLLKEKLVPIILSKLLNDSNSDIVVESFGLLRNLSLEEGYDVSIHLWRSDIWTSIASNFAKIIDSLSALQAAEQQSQPKPAGKAKIESKRLLFDFADNLLSLVVALSNGSDDILNEILMESKINEIFQVILQLLNYGIEKLPINLFNTILDLIYDLSSESFEFIDHVSNNELLSQFLNGLSPDLHPQTNELTKVLIEGIHCQFLDMKITYDQCNKMIHSVCHSINNIDPVQLINDINNPVEIAPATGKDESGKVIDKIKDYNAKRNESMMKLQSIEIAIDLITAITEIVASKYESPESHEATIPDELINTLTNFLPHVFMILKDTFTSRILIGWNNLIWLFVSLSLTELSEELLTTLWSYITQLDSQDDLSIKIGRMGCIWAFLKLICPDGAFKSDNRALINIQMLNNSEFAKGIISEFQNSNDLELQQKCINVLSTYAMIHGQIEVNKEIGQFFIQTLAQLNVSPEILIEMTNSLFQIYGDASYDYNEPIFVSGGFLPVLKDQVVPNLRQQFKMVDKNKDPKLKERCHDCFTTLDSFIHYKMSENSTNQ
ncbi:Syo1p [Saccharomyces paradoxus]|uniref:Syo1p n=1 Tax=Saccharomyces paradoxus TaxID=27291 RepID=A0A8B8UN61_SACPA|nr:Syo1 [Saccharomyces paradoxus]QHS72172.1 Syo1 [Saccharomyces paradoxus]